MIEFRNQPRPSCRLKNGACPAWVCQRLRPKAEAILTVRSVEALEGLECHFYYFGHQCRSMDRPTLALPPLCSQSRIAHPPSPHPIDRGCGNSARPRFRSNQVCLVRYLRCQRRDPLIPLTCSVLPERVLVVRSKIDLPMRRGEELSLQGLALLQHH